MKKFIALILALVLVLSMASFAFAEPFDISTSSTSVYAIGCSYNKVYNSPGWYISISESRSNLSPTHRAVARCHNKADAISATWVYSGTNSSQHPYNTSAKAYISGATFRGRLDDRDSGTLEFHGTFTSY